MSEPGMMPEPGTTSELGTTSEPGPTSEPGTIARWADALMPEGAAREHRRRARLVLGVSIGLGAIIIVGTLLRLAMGRVTVSALIIICLAALALTTTPIWLRRGAVQTAGAVCTIAFLLLVLGAGWRSGGLQAPIFLLLPSVPLLATYLVGPRAGLATVGVLLSFVAVLAVVGPLEPFDAPWRVSEERDVLARALMVSLCLLLVGLASVVIESGRLRSERHRRRSHGLYRSLFHQSKDVVAISTPEGRVVDVNQEGLDLYGFLSPAEIKTFDLRDLYVDPGQRDELRKLLDEKGFVREYETVQRRLDGSEMVIQGTTSAVRDLHGGVSYWLSILRDVTEARENEHERARMIDELERKNAELEHFAGTVAHDLRGPLFTLRGYLELLQAGEAPEADDLETLLATADRMSALLDELLNHALLGHDTLALGTVSMVDLAQQVVDDLGGRLRAKHAEVTISPDLPPAQGDATLIRQLLQNLLENAVKFSARHVDRPMVHIDHRIERGQTIYRISDNGPGIAPDQRERVFGLFFRQEGHEEAGTGIGLAAVAKIARLHGGRAWVEPDDPPGATLAFTLESPG